MELTAGFPEEKFLWNPDIHPVPISRRTWGALTYFLIWVSMAFIVPSWTLASIGLLLGLTPLQAIFTVFLGNLIVVIPMIIQSHGGARYGIAEPQLTRTRWGTYGAMFPSWVRAVIGAGWWGIESYIIAEAATALYAIYTGRTSTIAYTVAHFQNYPFVLAKDFPSIFWATFVIVIAAQMLVFYLSPIVKSQPALRWLARVGGPIVMIAFVSLWVYFMSAAGWSVNLSAISGQGHFTWLGFLAFLNANIAFWATMALTMPDYTRFARSQSSQTYGQLTMPFLMLAVAAFSVMTTAAAYELYGKVIWDPIVLTALYMTRPLGYFVLISIMLATFLVNAFANAVGPAYDIANTFPKHMSWFKGSLALIAIAVGIGAWSYYGNAYSYITNWLLTYGGLLGGIEGVIIFDYAVVRRFKLDLADVFKSDGIYRYWHGINPAAVITFLIVTVLIYAPLPYHQVLFNSSWLLSFTVSGLIYLPLMKYWVIPKYQPQLSGGLLRGYLSPYTRRIFMVESN
ncbi:cytosine permease [Acidilobus saccharovorans]|uniref:cytosine permease n=1 Tax=Acidilobus saccharovorans TaxID=242703 RepID=UPI001930FDFB|nr:cytosine permease [Acidilobus saccharovorans]